MFGVSYVVPGEWCDVLLVPITTFVVTAERGAEAPTILECPGQSWIC